MDKFAGSMPAVEAFVHEPLDLTKPTIRVLQILPGRREEPIRCKLAHVPRKEDSYVCLSYAWGSEGRTHPILINDQCLEVRTNLWNFLSRARKLEIRDCLWIDAVCIDQANVQERNHQVQQMGDIYRIAKRVLIYPGELPRSLRLAMRLAVEWDSPAFDRRLLQSGYDLLLRSLFRIDLKRAAQLRYWNRIWIIQEILLAQDIRLVSKWGLIRWEHWRPLFATHGLCFGRKHGANKYMVGELCMERGKYDSADMRTRFPFVFQRVFRTFNPVRDEKSIHEATCADVRDHVYSLLGLASDAADFVVDYRKPPGVLLLDTVEHFAKYSCGSPNHTLAQFIDKLKLALRVSLSCYCHTCASRVSGLSQIQDAVPDHLQSATEGVILAVEDAKENPFELGGWDTCNSCGKWDVLRRWFGIDDYYTYTFNRLDACHVMIHLKRQLKPSVEVPNRDVLVTTF